MVSIGTSGYSYPDWQGRFYPTDLPQARWLEYYAEHFSAVELNVTFYRLPASPTFRHWRTRTPKDFRFVVKGSRLITHQQRLHDCHEPLAALFERASELQEKWAGILWQLPPRFDHDPDLLQQFLEEVERVQLVYGKVRQAIEFRDPSWLEASTYRILEAFQVAIVLADQPFAMHLSRSPSEPTDHDQRTHHRNHHHFMIPQTANFHYVRCHGPVARNGSAYSEEQIGALAQELVPYLPTNDVYVFFTNDTQAEAITNAQQLQQLVADPAL